MLDKRDHWFPYLRTISKLNMLQVRKATERVQEENNEQEIERKSGVRTMIMNVSDYDIISS